MCWWRETKQRGGRREGTPTWRGTTNKRLWQVSQPTAPAAFFGPEPHFFFRAIFFLICWPAGHLTDCEPRWPPTYSGHLPSPNTPRPLFFTFSTPTPAHIVPSRPPINRPDLFIRAPSRLSCAAITTVDDSDYLQQRFSQLKAPHLRAPAS